VNRKPARLEREPNESQPLFVPFSVTKRGRPPIGKKAMTDAERQRRHRRLLKGKTRRGQRTQREQDLAARTMAAAAELGQKLYAVIYADPPWRFEPYSRDTGMDRAADNHYPTMTLDDIKVLPIPAADDAVLFMWATVPMLGAAMAVMVAWGFAYRTNFVWVKDKIGTGYWNRNQHEHLLVGVRGNVPAPAPGDQVPSVITAPRGAHSVKPAVVRKMIDAIFPTLPRLEMFARGDSILPGWDVWGNEAAMTAQD
jgi:N6-adenosine-specific RNA methylase IME4